MTMPLSYLAEWREQAGGRVSWDLISSTLSWLHPHILAGLMEEDHSAPESLNGSGKEGKEAGEHETDSTEGEGDQQ